MAQRPSSTSVSSPRPLAPSPLSPLHPARPTLSPSFATRKGDHQLPTRRCQRPHSGTCPKSNALCPCRLSLTVCVLPHAAPLLDLPNEHLRILLDNEEDARCCTAPPSGLPVRNYPQRCSKAFGSAAWLRSESPTAGSEPSLSVTPSGGLWVACSQGTSPRSSRMRACHTNMASTPALERKLSAVYSALPPKRARAPPSSQLMLSAR